MSQIRVDSEQVLELEWKLQVAADMLDMLNKSHRILVMRNRSLRKIVWVQAAPLAAACIWIVFR